MFVVAIARMMGHVSFIPAAVMPLIVSVGQERVQNEPVSAIQATDGGAQLKFG